MEKKSKTTKTDRIFLMAALGIAVVGFLYYFIGIGTKGSQVVITVDGTWYGTYSLNMEQEIPIVIDGTTTNVLQITGGKAMMVEADCPDLLCVHQRAISKKNETIVCLPNKVVVKVESNEESEYDSIAQ